MPEFPPTSTGPINTFRLSKYQLSGVSIAAQPEPSKPVFSFRYGLVYLFWHGAKHAESWRDKFKSVGVVNGGTLLQQRLDRLRLVFSVALLA